MTSVIPYGRQNVSEDDIRAVVEVLRSEYLTQGPVVPAFERAVADYCDARYAVAVNSATSALHIACLSLGVGSGDLVWTSPISFVASANCARYCGADVDFVDINPKTYNICVARLADKLEHAKMSGRLPKILIPVHLAGQSCEMETIHILSKKYGFNIIEDASHAIGGQYKDFAIGSCRFSDITVFSFHPVKIITSGEGGMALTNDPMLFGAMSRLRSHGITRSPSEMTHAPDGPWYYQQIELGFNYRMTEIQAALGLNQMKRLDSFVGERRIIASYYDELLSDLPIVLPAQCVESNSSWHLYIIRVKVDSFPSSRAEIFERLRFSGVMVNLHYIPIYRHPYYEKIGFNIEGFDEAESYYAEAITLPIYPGLQRNQQEYICQKMVTPMGHQTIF
jgi:UDP-4-amino-4,6-dideoxy-N-acetyl-beta-L-altrosamine transaminase